MKPTRNGNVIFVDFTATRKQAPTKKELEAERKRKNDVILKTVRKAK